MNQLPHFLTEYGYAVLIVWVFAEQAGLPIPAIPMLLAMGALIGNGTYTWPAALLGALAACLAADSAWFFIGRAKGRGVLKLLCKISLEPDSCVKTTERGFQRYGWTTLLGAKFLPGLSTAAPPLAGMTGMSFGKFLLADGVGSLLWAAAFMAAGAVFHHQLEVVVVAAAQLGSSLGMTVSVALIAWLGYKYYQRRSFLNLMYVNRMSVDDLHERRDLEDFFLIDMRDPWEIKRTGVIPGGVIIGFRELDARHEEIPRDKEIILYCS